MTISDAGMELSTLRNGSWSLWMSVINRSSSMIGGVSRTYRATLYGGENDSEIIDLMKKSLLVSGTLDQATMHSFVNGFLDVFGKDGRFDIDGVTDEKIKAFTKSVSEQSFRHLLGNHEVSKRLTYEQALAVIQEIYVVEPVMTT